MVAARTNVGGVGTPQWGMVAFIPQVDITKNNMQALTKEQLEELGFTVKERVLKKGLKIDIYFDGCYGDYIGYWEKYPTFQDIIGNVVKEAQDESERLWKNRLMERLVGDGKSAVYLDM